MVKKLVALVLASASALAGRALVAPPALAAITLPAQAVSNQTQTYTSRLTQTAPSQTYSLTSGTGTLSARVGRITYAGKLTLELRNAGGLLMARKTATAPVRIAATAQPGIHRVTITSASVPRPGIDYSLSITYPVSDTVSPTVAISSPATGSTVSGAQSVTGSATDDMAVSKVEVSIDGGVFQPATGTSGWYFSWNSTGVSNGAHTIAARATDTSNNSSFTSVSVTVKNSAPPDPPTAPPPSGSTPKYSDPGNNPPNPEPSKSITTRPEGSASAGTYVEIWVGGCPNVDGFLYLPDQHFMFDFDGYGVWNTTGLAPGTYDIRAVCDDRSEHLTYYAIKQ